MEQQSEVEYQRDLQRRAQAGDRVALGALYESFEPLIKSRMRRIACQGMFGGWYDDEDLAQDAYLVFHGFVMSCDPDVPLYRLIAGAFERTLWTQISRHGPLRSQVPTADEREDRVDSPVDSVPSRGPSAHEVVCGRELLSMLEPEQWVLAVLATAGYSAGEIAEGLGCSIHSVRHQRRLMRDRLRVKRWAWE